MRFREVGGHLKKKVSPEENMISVAVQKAFCVLLAVSRREVAQLRTEHSCDGYTIQTSASVPPHPLPHGGQTDRMTQTHSVVEPFDATCSLEACRPAQATGKSSHPASHFSQTPQKQVSEN